ncbi:MAG: hypothetical protein J07HQW2_01435 [Haloquadratum walsbyi J07HQW2]|uniref:VTT domain-containing protein n=2 Tax=Haloquadratum walsbyi TaxID=293091 RepID=U1PMM9_9EURY|nr:MAG: hypothetical protein J07HQW2_01435 [Haloquadratum walsbyi J07HQW2]
MRRWIRYLSKRQYQVAGGILVITILIAAVSVSPAVVFNHLTWTVADPVRVILVASGLAIVRPLFAWPTTLLAIIIGYGIGFTGLPFALGLITCTSIPPYFLGRQYNKANSHPRVVAEFVERTGDTRSVVATRLTPAPSDVVSVGAGIAGVSMVPFTIGTVIGELPWAIAGVLVGASAETLVGGVSVTTLIHPRLIAAGSIVAGIIIAPPIWAWIRE